MIPAELESLRIAELSRLMLHESHEPDRLDLLKRRMASEGVQSNPVIVSEYEDKLLVLDGAHRVHALRELGLELALIQLVETPERAEGWQHLLNGGGLLNLESIGVFGGDGDSVAEIEAPGGEVYALGSESPGDVVSEVELLWRLYSLYPKDSSVTRVEPGESVALSEDETLVRYRSFTTTELAEVVAREAVLPAGITRFHVPRRVLGVKFPLESLKKDDPDSANSELRSLIEKRRLENRIRRYDEPITLFE